MNSVAAANARWNVFSSNKKVGAEPGDDSFSRVFDVAMQKMPHDRENIREMLDNLRQRFPHAAIQEGKVGAGVKGTEAFFGDAAEDRVAVDPSALAAMAGNSELAKKVEDAIAAFLTGTEADRTVSGTSVQRRVSITVTTIRLTVIRRDTQSGEMKSADELTASLHEKLKELLERFFGRLGEPAHTEKAEGEDKTPAPTGEGHAENKRKPGMEFGNLAWSLELYFSSSFIQSFAGNADFAEQSRLYGFEAVFGGLLTRPDDDSFATSLHSILSGASSSSGGPFTSLLDGMGWGGDGFRDNDGGYNLKLRGKHTPITELLERHGVRDTIREKTPKTAGADEARVAQQTSPVA